jgi:hypothetical protein
VFKAGGKAGSTPMLIIGLDLDTIKSLLSGKPVQFPTGQLGIPHMQVLMVFGPTTDFIKARLAEVGWLKITDTGELVEATEVDSPFLMDNWAEHLMAMGGLDDSVKMRTGPLPIQAAPVTENEEA